MEEWSQTERKKKEQTLKSEKGSSKQRHLSAQAERGEEAESTIAVLQKGRKSKRGCSCTSEKGKLESLIAI